MIYKLIMKNDFYKIIYKINIIKIMIDYVSLIQNYLFKLSNPILF